MRDEIHGLVGDIGGTNARLALLDEDGRLRDPRNLRCADYRSLADLVGDYLKAVAGRRCPPRAALAVAGPVIGGETAFTNLDWTVSEIELLGAFPFEAVNLINDFAAQAMAAPVLEADDLRHVGPEVHGDAAAPVAVLGPGTGFGVAGLVRSDLVELPLATEGAHSAFAPCDEVEVEIWRRLKTKYGRVSKERILSGAGLYDLYLALADIEGAAASLPDQEAVTAAAASGEGLAVATVDRFCEILGSVAGDLALVLGARGGVFIGGGIAPKLIDSLVSGGFRRRFEEKGRLTDYVRAIPTAVILHPYAALLGAARELKRQEGLRL